MGGNVRVLLVADTHLGFDLPVRPRIERRRRGHDFLANYARALEPALADEVDVVIHAGDVFDRSSVVTSLAYQAFEPLRRIADRGIPVVIVPGNHERSRLPHLRFAHHRDVHIFGTPRTIVIEVRGVRIALSGFPYERRNVRARFRELLEQTRWSEHAADIRLLCLHHCVEGATVGPADYTFTTAGDVIRTRDVPPAFAAVLSGHIHRHQVLTTDLRGRALATPVMYPGSIERTAFAEIGETKGFMMLDVGLDAGMPRVRWEFRELPARPMLRRELDAGVISSGGFSAAVEAIMAAAPDDAVLSIRVSGALSEEHWRAVSAARLRALQPAMTVEIVPVERVRTRQRAAESAPRVPEAPVQLNLLA
jgi:DNA repair exonuclease SbcCD nuclease subunit